MSSRFDNITDLALEYAELKVSIDMLTKKKEQIEKQIKPILADQGAQVFDDQVVLEAVTVEGRETLDRAAIEEAFGNLSGFMKKGKPYIRMSVKMLG